MGMLMIKCPRHGKNYPLVDMLIPRLSAVPRYFSAALTVHFANWSTSGLPKTPGSAIPRVNDIFGLCAAWID
jgi:hypothetical protein